MARDSHDVYTTSNSTPWRLRSRPAYVASCLPCSASGTSSHPVNSPSWFAVVLPWRMMMITGESTRRSGASAASDGAGVAAVCCVDIASPCGGCAEEATAWSVTTPAGVGGTTTTPLEESRACGSSVAGVPEGEKDSSGCFSPATSTAPPPWNSAVSFSRAAASEVGTAGEDSVVVSDDIWGSWGSEAPPIAAAPAPDDDDIGGLARFFLLTTAAASVLPKVFFAGPPLREDEARCRGGVSMASNCGAASGATPEAGKPM
mmetsp:Transcript_27088/g.108453  ORF Transcript_27088/g.108453 Transcript_27088/m.108453 type:complete len:260 (+) Transcript_27088:1222-2001(+)